MREKLPALRQALQGRVKPHHQLLITQILAHIAFLDTSIGQLTQEIEAQLAPSAEAMVRLQTIPGIGERIASVIIAEIGTDRSRFARATHVASWAGLCPGNRQSGGRRLSGKPTDGDTW